MSLYLLDTNILLRMCDRNASTHLLAGQATAKLLSHRAKLPSIYYLTNLKSKTNE